MIVEPKVKGIFFAANSTSRKDAGSRSRTQRKGEVRDRKRCW